MSEKATSPKYAKTPTKTVPLEEIPPPPDGGWGWVVCLASFMCNLILDGIAYSFGILLEPLVNHFQSDNSTISWVGSLYCGIYMSSGPIVGGLVNKFGCRPVCIAGAIFSCLSIVLSTFSPNVGVLMLTYGIMGGFGVGCIYLPAVVACGYYFEKRRALATGIAVCGSGVGTFVFAPLANFLLDQYGWKGANLIFAALCFNCAVFGALMRPLELVVTSPITNIESPISVYSSEPEQQQLVKQRLWDEGPTLREEDEILREEDEVEIDDGFYDVTLKNNDNADEGEVLSLPADTEAETFQQKRRRYRTNSESFNMKNRLQISKTIGGSAMKRNVSTPGFSRLPTSIELTRLDSTTNVQDKEIGGLEERRLSSFFFEVQDGSTQQLKPYNRRSSRATLRPLSRKDIFYSGSVYNLALEMQEQKMMTDQSLLKGRVLNP